MQTIGKIGLGVITYNAFERFSKSVSSIPWSLTDVAVVVNDGTPYDVNPCPSYVHQITHEKNKGVGAAKNTALKYLLDQGCEHIFLMEDDVIIKDPGIFLQYIDAAKITGIQHFNFSLQDNENRDSLGNPTPLQVLNYNGVPLIALYGRCLACFSYFTRRSIEGIQLHVEEFENAWEHVELTYRIAKNGMYPIFHWHPDLINSDQFLTTIPDAESHSTIRTNPEWNAKIARGADLFKVLHGLTPYQIPHISLTEILDNLRQIKSNYGQ